MAASERFDFAVIGSGFAGSIMSMVLRRLGYSVVLLERGSHPRFVIGESSTPFANLLLERLAEEFDLPVLKQLSEWGSWQEHHPHLPVGLKRGFTFYQHTPTTRADFANREQQLLVAASPNDRVADTHWYRPDFDRFLVEEAKRAGVRYLDNFKVRAPELQKDWLLSDGSRTVQAEFIVDASGPAGVLAEALQIPIAPFSCMPKNRALYAHFADVPRTVPGLDGLPYPPEDAALHHVFEDGWMWVLRFNNGITSAGFTSTAAELPSWEQFLARYPTIREQFRHARPLTPFFQSANLNFRRSQAVGERFALLPSATAFVDPLLSTGFAVTLLGILRLAEIFRSHRSTETPHSLLSAYEAQTLLEAEATADLVSALYAKMPSFPEFARLTKLYFAALSFTETAWRLNKQSLASGFLLTNNQSFTAARQDLCARARAGHPITELELHHAIRPFDIAGLRRTDCQNWFPVDLDALIENCHKLEATESDLHTLFRKLQLQI